MSTDLSVHTTVSVDSSAYLPLLSNYDVKPESAHPLGYRCSLKPSSIDELTGVAVFPIKTVGWESNERCT